MKGFWLRRGLRFLAFALLFIGLAGFAVMSLWNALLPAILGVKAISFGQAIGLLALSRLLFGGFRGPWGRPGFGGGGPGRKHWKQKMTERWQTLTPEQREAMRQKWSRCGERGGRSRFGRQSEQPGQPTPDTAAPTGPTTETPG